MEVDTASLLFDLCDNLRTPFVPRIHLFEDNDPTLDSEPNGDGLNGYIRMRVTDFVREYVGGSKPAILRVDEPQASGASSSAQVGVSDGTVDKFHWAVRWHSNEYLVQKVKGDAEKEPPVTVALTPNGRADAITRLRHQEGNDGSSVRDDVYFASASEVKMPLSAFFEHLAAAQYNDMRNEHHNNMTIDEEEGSMGPDAAYHRYVDLISRCAELKAADGPTTSPSQTFTNNVIPYIQLQNSSLSTEYRDSLHGDVPSYVKDMGRRLFGQTPEAENLWIGSSLSSTSMHKDWSENLYWVIRGVKTFTLIAPWEAPYLKKRMCKPVTYMYEEGSSKASSAQPHDGCYQSPFKLLPTLKVDEDSVCEVGDGLVEWIATDFIDDPAPIGARKGDTRHQCHPVTARVHSGEVLYLPAMWFHAVEQQEDEESDGDEESEETTEKEEEEGRQGGLEDDSEIHPRSELLSTKAASAPCVIAVNYWFEMHCGGPLFWMQEMLKGLYPQSAK